MCRRFRRGSEHCDKCDSREGVNFTLKLCDPIYGGSIRSILHRCLSRKSRSLVPTVKRAKTIRQTNIPLALILSWLDFFDRKVGQTDLVFGVQSSVISRSVQYACKITSLCVQQ